MATLTKTIPTFQWGRRSTLKSYDPHSRDRRRLRLANRGEMQRLVARFDDTTLDKLEARARVVYGQMADQEERLRIDRLLDDLDYLMATYRRLVVTPWSMAMMMHARALTHELRESVSQRKKVKKRAR